MTIERLKEQAEVKKKKNERIKYIGETKRAWHMVVPVVELLLSTDGLQYCEGYKGGEFMYSSLTLPRYTMYTYREGNNDELINVL